MTERRSPPEPGLYEDVRFREYLSWDCASRGRLVELERSPAHLRAMLNGEDGEESEAQIVGKAAHAAVLEPDIYGERYVQAERCCETTGSGSRCSYNGKHVTRDGDWYCGTHVKGVPEEEIVDDATVLTEKQAELVKAVRDSVFESTAARRILRSDGPVELAGVAEDGPSGVLCKVRTDKIAEPFESIVDLKTARDASRRSFSKTIFRRRYHLQGALYLRVMRALGVPVKRYTIIAVEKTPPYAVATYKLTDGTIDAGEELLDALLPLYAETVERDHWPGYPDKVQEIALPAWAWNETEDLVFELEERR